MKYHFLLLAIFSLLGYMILSFELHDQQVLLDGSIREEKQILDLLAISGSNQDLLFDIITKDPQ